MTLLEEAKSLKHHQSRYNPDLNDEEVEIIAAYLKREISSHQLRTVTKKSGVQIYSFIVKGVRRLIERGELQFRVAK